MSEVPLMALAADLREAAASARELGIRNVLRPFTSRAVSPEDLDRVAAALEQSTAALERAPDLPAEAARPPAALAVPLNDPYGFLQHVTRTQATALVTRLEALPHLRLLRGTYWDIATGCGCLGRCYNA